MANEKNKPDEAPTLENEGMVKMVKDGEVSFVHPTCVDAHKRVLWVEVSE